MIAIALLFSTRANAGGPAFVAGTAFDPSMSGKPILWANGTISYYTDRGDLSPLLPQSAANAFVADAFSRWTSVAPVALTATRTGVVSYTPAVQAAWGAAQVGITATAGTNSSQSFNLQVFASPQ